MVVAAGLAVSTAAVSTSTVASADNSMGVAHRNERSGRPILLKSGMIETQVRGRDLADLLRASRTANSSSRLVAQLDGPLDPARRDALREAGVKLGGYLGNGAHLIDVSDADPAAVERLGFVRWADTLRPEWKIDKRIGSRALQSAARRTMDNDGFYALLVMLHDGADADTATAALEAIHGVTVTSAADELGVLGLVAPKNTVNALAAVDDVAFVEEMPEAALRNNTVRWIVQSNVNNSAPLHDAGLTGAGQIIGIQDSYADTNHCSFDDTGSPGPNHRKWEHYGPAYPQTTGTSHGTHVAGIAAGNAFVAGDTRGHAYDAKIAFEQYPSFADKGSYLNFWTTGTEFAASLQTNHDAGARVHTNSWGDDSSGHYNGWSYTADKFSHDNEEDVVLVAITNIATDFNNPENAKNILAVASTEDTPNQDDWGNGGIGPTRELEHLDPGDAFWASSGLTPETYGRRKPDIMAPGKGVLSSAHNTVCQTRVLSGTSMATPAVAGMVALTRQYYMDGFYPSGAAVPGDAYTPTGALLRATVLNSGQDMTGDGPTLFPPENPNSLDGYPSNREGWGRIAMQDALHFTGESRNLQTFDIRHADAEALADSEMNEHIVRVCDAAEQLRITMVFTDPEPAAAAQDVVVNDIDLEVISPSGVVYKGNVFDTAIGESIVGGAFDPRNNVEQMHLSSPELGPWKVRIHGANVNAPDQGYAVVATGALVLSCFSDLTHDGNVDGADLAELLANWGGIGPSDINADGVVDGADLAELLAAWGPC